MKRILIIALAFVAFAFTSCQKEPIGGTAVQDASGQWYITRQVVYSDGTVEDLFGPDNLDWFGKHMMLTYNTSDNESDKLFVDDLGEWYSPDDGMYLDFKVKATVDLSSLTISGSALENYYEDNTVDIQGAILKDAAKSAGGMPVDSIWMTVKISDDDYAAIMTEMYQYYGYDVTFEQWDHFLISGIRYTGFTADE